MVKGSDGQDYPDHLDYTCVECGEWVDPANCDVIDYGIVVHPDYCSPNFKCGGRE